MPRAAHTEAESSPGSEPRSLHIHPSQQSHSPDFTNAEGSTSTPPVLSLLHISEMTNSDDDTDVVEPPITHSAAHPLPFISGSHRPFTIQSMLNPLSPVQGMGGFGRNARPDMSNAMQDTTGTGPVGVLGDPVSRGLLSVEMAQQLYTL